VQVTVLVINETGKKVSFTPYLIEGKRGVRLELRRGNSIELAPLHSVHLVIPFYEVIAVRSRVGPVAVWEDVPTFIIDEEDHITHTSHGQALVFVERSGQRDVRLDFREVRYDLTGLKLVA